MTKAYEVIGTLAVIGEPLIGPLAVIGEDEPVGELVIDGSTTAAARPRAGSYQRVGYEVEIAGALVQNLMSVSVERSLDQHIQTWSMTIELPVVNGLAQFPFRNPWNIWAPSIGLDTVAIFGVYQTETGVHRFSLISRGVCHGENLDHGKGGTFERFQGGDAGARVDQALVTLILKRGHGLRDDRVVELLLRAAGETRFRLEPGSPMYHQLQYVDTPGVRSGLDIMESKGRRLLWDGDANVRNPRMGFRGSSPIEVELEEQDLLAVSSVSVEVPGAVITDITLTADQQVIRDVTETAGLASLPRETETIAPYAPRVAERIQSNLCVLNSTGLSSGLASQQPIIRTKTTPETRDGVLVATTIEVESHIWEEAARRIYVAPGMDCRGGVYVHTSTDPAGSEPAYAAPFERWGKRSKQTERLFYDKLGFRGPQGNSSDPWWNHFYGTLPQAGNGRYLGSIRETFSLYQRRAAVKQAVGGFTWEELDPIPNRLFNGNGEGVLDSVQAFTLTERVVEQVIATPDGFVESEIEFHYAYSRAPGTAFLYAGGGDGTKPIESSQEFETFGLVSVVRTDYLKAAENRFRPIVTFFLVINGAQVFQKQELGEWVSGPPEVDSIEETDPEADLYATEEEAEEARIARSTETRTIKVRIHLADLELYHVASVYKTSVDAESPEDLEAMALDMARRSSSFGVVFVTPANFQLREGSWIRLTVRPLGIVALVFQIHSVRYSQDGYTGPRLTTFQARRYLEI